MEQNDSLRNELQNLSRLQAEQIEILKSMNDTQRQELATKNIQSLDNKNMFTGPAMYQNAAGPYQYANANFASHITNPYMMQSTGGLSQYASNIQNAGNKYGFLNVVSPGSQYGIMSRELMSMDYGSRISKATVAGVGAVASTATSFGLSAILPGLAGFGAPMLAGAAAGMFTDAAFDQIDQNNALKKYIYKNSGRFINSFESNNDRGLTGFSRNESEEAADFVRKLNTDFYMSNEEMSSLLQSYTEGGLLKDTKDLESFKEKMKTLTKSVKEGALMLNETYDSIADLMAEMKKAGIDVKDFNSSAGLANIIGGLTGLDASDILRNLVNYTVNVNGGTGNSSNDTLSRVEDMTIYMSEYFNRLEEDKDKDPVEESNYNMIKNLGGSVEASKYMNTVIENMMDSQDFLNAGMAFFDYNADTKMFDFNKDNFNKFTSGNMSYREMYDNASEKFNELVNSGNGAAVNLWNNQGATYLKNNLEDGQMTTLVGKVLSALSSDPELAANGFDYRTALSEMGVKDTGVQNLLTGLIDFRGNNPDLAKKVNLQNVWQQQITSQIANAPSLTEQVGAWWENTKEGVTQVAVDFDNWAGNKMQDFSNWLNGIDKLPVRYDKTFNMKSDLKRISYDDVVAGLSETTDMVSLANNSINAISSNGYTIDQNLKSYINSKYDSSDKTIQYSRSVIADWSKVGTDTQENKDLIQNIALQNKISEIIVASLVKYKQSNPDSNMNIAKTSEELGQQLFNYGGNQNLAMAAMVAGQSNVDKILQSQGINTEFLRETGTQEQLKNYNMQDLNLSEDQMNKIKNMFQQNVFNGSSGGSGGTGNISDIYGNEITTEDLVYRDLRNKSGLTAEDMELLIKDVKAKNPNSMLEEGMGAKFIEAEEKTGVDALYWFSHAMLETGYGTSNILAKKNNWYGWGAVDSAPMAGAWTFEDRADAIVETAEKIAANYQNSSKNQQSTLYDMRWSNPGHQYASDTEWDDKIANIWKNSIQFFQEKGIGLNYEGGTSNGEYIKEEKVYKDIYGEDIQNTLSMAIDNQYKMLKGTGDYNNLIKAANSLKQNKSAVDSLEEKVVYGMADEVTEQMEKDLQDMQLKLYNSIADQLNIEGLDSMEGKTLGDMMDFADTLKKAFKEKMQGMIDFVNGDDTDAAKAWSSLSSADKMGQIELFKQINENVGGGEFLEKMNLNSAFTEDELNRMRGIVNGTFNGAVQGSSDAEDYREWLLNGQNRVSSQDAVSKYLAGTEGFGNASDENSLSKATDFMKQAQLFNDSGEMSINNMLSEKATASLYDDLKAQGFDLKSSTNIYMKDVLASVVNEYKGSISDALSSGKYGSIEEILAQNEDVIEARKGVTAMFKDSSQAEKYLSGLDNLYDISSSVNKNGSYNVLQTFGSAFYGIDESAFNGNIDQYNKQLVRSANEFYQYYSQGFTDYLSGAESEQGDRVRNMTAVEKSTYFDVMKQMQYALDISEGDNSDAYSTVDEIFNGDKTKMYTQEEYDKMRHITENGIYDATFYNETESESDLISRFEDYIKNGQRESRSSSIRADLMASGVGQGIDSGDTLEEIRNAIKEQIEIAKEENKNAILNAEKMGEAVANKMQEVGFEASQEELDKIKNFLEYGDVEGLNAMKQRKIEEGELVDTEAFDKLIEVAENIKSLDVSGLTQLLTTMQDISNIVMDTGTTATMLYQDTEDMGGYKESFENAMREGLKEVFGSDSNILTQSIDKLLTDLSNGKGEIDGVEISANTLEQLAAITADAVDAGLRETLSSDGGVDVITNSSLYSSVGNDTMDSMASTIKELSDKIKEAGETSAEGKSLAEQQNQLIDAFVQSYQESLKQLGTTAEQSKNDIEDVAKNTQDTIDTFKTTMSKYDSAIESAINTMQDTISNIQKQTNSRSFWQSLFGSNDSTVVADN